MEKRNNLFPSLTTILLVIILALTGCNLPVTTSEPTDPATAETPSAESSPDAALLETGTPDPAIPTFTPTSESSPAADCDRVQFITDVNHIDYSSVNANEEITKTWRIKNVGSCTWDANYKLVFSRGEQMDGPSPADVITAPVAPGASVEISIPLKAPDKNGNQMGVWQFHNPADKPVLMLDGNPLELSILVIVTNGTGGQVSSVRGWVYTYVGGKCSSSVNYDVSVNIYANGPVNVGYTWSTSNGLLSLVSETYVFTSAGNVQVTTRVSPPYADPNNIRLTLTANGTSSSFTICPSALHRLERQE